MILGDRVSALRLRCSQFRSHRHNPLLDTKYVVDSSEVLTEEGLTDSGGEALSTPESVSEPRNSGGEAKGPPAKKWEPTSWLPDGR